MRANNVFFQHAGSGSDIAQQVDAVRELYVDINDDASTGMDTIQVPNSFYAFDERRVNDEIAYRKALQVELSKIGQNVSRMGSMPRTNN